MQPDRLPKPGSLEAKFKLMLRLPLDGKARRKHIAVFGFILDWWHKDYGNALASLRHIVGELERRSEVIEGAKGIGRTHVSSALADLKEWGYLIQLPGGVRGTGRYAPNWDLVCTVHTVGDSEGNQTTVHTSGDSVSTTQGTVEALSVHTVGDKDPSTGPGLQNRGQVGWNIDTLAAGAPPLEGADAAARDPEGEDTVDQRQYDPFDQFWTAYPRKFQKPKARAAWAKLDPPPALAERIIEAAKAWAAHYEVHPIDKKWMPTPANWLAGERYDEDLPDVYEDPKEAAKVRAKDKAEGRPKAKATLSSDDSEPPSPANDNLPAPRPVTIVDSTIAKDGFGDSYIQLSLADTDLPENTERIVITYEHTDRLEQDAGQRDLSDLCSALELDGVDDTEELHGKTFLYGRTIFGTHKFYPAATAEAQEA